MNPSGRLLILCPVLLALAGCLKHKESITVTADGAVTVVHQIKGDEGDIKGGAAELPGAEHFDVARSVRTKDDGKEEHILTARGRFASVAAMPTTHARADDPLKASALRFTNDLKIRREQGRTLYIFTRTYEPRSWARYQFHDDKIFSKEIKALVKDFEKRSAAEQQKVIAAFLRYERAKNEEWMADALKALESERTLSEAEVAVRSALGAHFKKTLGVERVARLLEQPREELSGEVERIQRGIEGVIGASAARVLGLSREDQARFMKAYRLAQQDFKVSEDLGDEAFEVSVTLPGKPLYDNCDRRRGRTFTWSFGGKDLRDREQRLIAVSVVND